jgi:hypothetical protein
MALIYPIDFVDDFKNKTPGPAKKNDTAFDYELSL